MTHHAFIGLLIRRGVWMTPLEIFLASPEYPIGDYVLTDLHALKANRLLVSRQRPGTRLTEYGLPTWVDAPTPAFSAAYFAYLVRRLFGQLAPGT
ncbi:MAG: hypothetical protein JO035_06435 [Betaproteobacteria bacterium]|nr:hypothetical protein [Betaproteobacteria bacterium]